MFDDEGYELAKALLMTHQRLYAPVWWDQPPVHPGLLRIGASLLGSGLESFRLVAGFLCAAALGALAACASPGRRGAGTGAPLTPSLAVNSPDRTQRLGADKERNSESLSASNLWGFRCGLGGYIAPFAAILLCLSSMGFLSYGLSVTIMLPALGFALWAVWLWQRFGLSGNRWVWFGSGIVFGLGFQTKFTVLLLLPALAVEFAKQAWLKTNAECGVRNAESAEGTPSPRPSPLAAQRAREETADAPSSQPSPPVGEKEKTMGAREKIGRALGFLGQWSGIWLAGFGYGVALVWAFFPEEDLIWLLKYHFRPEVTVPFESQAGLSPMLHKLGVDWPIAGFAVLGLFLGLVQRRWAVVFPTVFFVTAFLAHAWHRPWWDYYYLHLSLPMAWLGALGVQWAWDSLMGDRGWGMGDGGNAECGVRNAELERSASFRRRLLEFWPGWRVAGLIAAFSFCLAGFVVEWPERYERETAFLRAKPSLTEVRVLAELKARRVDTRWLYTDRPIWCAHANLLIPPELAVLSLKRIASGDITHAEFLRLLHHYRPEQIVLQRRHFEDEKFHEFLRAFYDVVVEEGNMKYLVRRDWEAARKQKRAGSSRREEAQLNAEGGVRNAESSVRLLTSSPTGVGRDSVEPHSEQSEASAASFPGRATKESRCARTACGGSQDSTESHPTRGERLRVREQAAESDGRVQHGLAVSPSPRPSPPVGAREKTEREGGSAGSASFPFVSIRVIRGHHGGQAG